MGTVRSVQQSVLPPLGGSMDIAENSNGVFVYYAVECAESVNIMIAN